MLVLTTFCICRETLSNGVERFNVRQWQSVVRGTARPVGSLKVAETLDAARRYIPAGLDNIGRDPEDDPAVVECWQ